MPKVKAILQYRCINCGNLSSLPLECCGDAMVQDPWDDLANEDYLYVLEDQLSKPRFKED